MTREFLTNSQQMTFVDSVAPYNLVNAWSLAAGHQYNVYFVLKNTGANLEMGVQCEITHSPFGIGSMGTTDGLTQPAAVNIPPHGPGGDGFAVVTFTYTPPAAGHTCLYAKILPGGPSIQQNTTSYSLQPNTMAKPSFIVYGHPTEPRLLILTGKELLESNMQVPTASAKWNFTFDLSQAGLAAAQNSPAQIPLPPGSSYTIGINTTPKGTEAHVFHIEGTEEGIGPVGMVDVHVKPDPAALCGPCDPYITGGYHSHDIILYDPVTHLPIPPPFNPASADLLRPNTGFGFAARVHNFSNHWAMNTTVRFWQHGFGSYGHLVDTQTANIPPHGSIVVHADHPFVSAPAMRHRCAIVSVFNSMATVCNHDAPTFPQLPPTYNGEPSCAAWRNTDSFWWPPFRPLELQLEAILPDLIHGPDPGPVEVNVFVQHLQKGWDTTAATVKLAKEIRRTAVNTEPVLALNPAIRRTFKPVEMELTAVPAMKLRSKNFEPVTAKTVKIDGDLSLKPAIAFRVARPDNAGEGIVAVPYTLKGKLPSDLKEGDQVLIHVTVRTGKKEYANAFDTDYFRILHIRKD